MSTITSANSTFALAVQDLYPSPQIIQGYATDDGFSTDALDMGEVVMGLDGRMSRGFVFAPVRMTVTIMPDSPSLVIFDTIVNATRTAREVFRLDATIQIPSIGTKYSLTNGVMTQGKPIPDAKKVLQSVQYVLTFERCIGEQY